MRFISKSSATAVTVNPRTDPSLVPVKDIFLVEPCLLNTDSPPTLSHIALEGVGGNTATVQVWVLDDTGFSGTSEIDYASAEWYSLGSPVALSVGALAAGPALPGGRIYLQVTVASAAASVVKVGSAP